MVYIAPLLPEVKASPKGGPKPIPNRPVFEGILWVLRSGARWKDLPDRYPSPSTCWRRLRAWEEQDVWLKAGPTRLGRNLRRWQLCPGEKRGACVGKTKRGKGTKWMVVVDGQGIPLGNYLESASPSEVTLIEPTLERVGVPRPGRGRPRKNPQRLIYDKAADSDPLRARLARRGIELICPHRKNRKKPPTQDGRPLRRYKRRWTVERTFSWWGNFRRLVVRWEYHIEMYQAFVNVACLWIVLGQL